jgi:hypothetical protein
VNVGGRPKTGKKKLFVKVVYRWKHFDFKLNLDSIGFGKGTFALASQLEKCEDLSAQNYVGDLID